MRHSNQEKDQIAIIGIGCHLPGGVQSPEELWSLLINKSDAITEVPKDRWDKRLFFDADKEKPGKTYVVQGGFLKEDITLFDSMFFGISPREAPNIDPQQRMLLEVTYEAIEDAGLQLESLRGRNVGVFIGGFFADFFLMQFNPINRDAINMHTAAGFSLGNLSNRISYTFDFRGPSLTIDTACSSSLVAIHHACQSIWNNESSLAIAGGVHIMLRPESFISVSKGGFLSQHGRCKTFDIEAGGYTRSEGAASIILKPYSQALADGDAIYALIKGTGVNQDGQTPAITIPNAEAQEALIRRVYKECGVSPSDIYYIEAHGTGTQAGDPVELKAINAVIAENRNADEKVLVGSLKSNMGHMEAVAGVSGLVKAALCLKKKMVPPNIHFKVPNPKLEYDSLFLKVPVEVEELPKNKLLTASVNSFGFGGTNAHAVLQEAPAIALNAPAESGQRPSLSILPVTARSEDALIQLAKDYIDIIKDDEFATNDIIYTCAKRRSHHQLRLGIAAQSREDMARLLEAYVNGQCVKGIVSNNADIKTQPKIAFIYTGMGPQWWKMGRELYENEPVFRQMLEKCDEIFKGFSGWSILEEMLKDEHTSKMAETKVAQPANFLMQVALTELLKRFGITPHAIAGHSVGEVASAYCSGALSLEDAILVSYTRSRLQQTTAGQGKMLAIGLSEEEALAVLVSYPDISIAAINSANSVTLAGEEDHLLEISKALDERHVFNKLMNVEVPYHSAVMDQIKDELLESLEFLKPSKEIYPLYSTVTGDVINGGSINAEYWWNNVRQTVRFAKTCSKMVEDGYTLFLEVGPHPVLKTSIKECLQNAGSKGICLQTLNRKEPELVSFYEAVAQFYTLGVNIDWSPFISGGKMVDLPRYPWQKEKCPFNETEASRNDRLGSEGHLFCNKIVSSPHLSYEVELNQHLLPFLNDHRVESNIVFPGAAYVEGALALFNAERPDSTGCCLENLRFHNMLSINGKEVQLLHSYLDTKNRDYGIYSRSNSNNGWMQHASGRILHEPVSKNAKPLAEISRLKNQCPEVLSVEQFYKDLASLGLQYYPYFRTVKEIYRGDKAIVARIEASASLTDVDKYFLHPTVLDGAIQTLAALFDKLVIPAKIGRVNYYNSPGGCCWSYLNIVNTTQASITGDLYLLDGDGNVFAELLDLECQRVPKDEAWKDHVMDSWIYDIVWEESQKPKTSSCDPYWLIFAHDNAETDAIAGTISKHGHEYRLVNAGDLSTDGYEKILSVFSDIKTDKKVNILYIPSPSANDTEDTDTARRAMDYSLQAVYIIQAWSKSHGDEDLKVGIITYNAYEVTGNETRLNLQAGGLTALNRLISNEHLNIVCKNIDLDVNPDEPVLSSAIDEMLSDNNDEDVAYRDHTRYVRHIIHTRLAENDGSVPQKEVFTNDANISLEIGNVGKPDSLYFREFSDRHPEPDEIEIMVTGCGIAAQDAYELMGRIPPKMAGAKEAKQVLGTECCGTVSRVGRNVSLFSPGDEVIACVEGGSIKSRVNVNQNGYVMKKPPYMASGDIVSIAPFILAVHGLINIAGIQKGSKVLIHDAAGAVGLAAVEVARKNEAEIYATAKNSKQIEYLKALGIGHVMDINSLDFINEIYTATDKAGVDIVFGEISGEKRTQSLRLLAQYGCFIQVGKNDSSEEIRLTGNLLNKNISISSIDLENICNNSRTGLKVWNQVREGFLSGAYAPLPQTVFDAQNAADCFTAAYQSESIGAVSLKISDCKIHLPSEVSKEIVKKDSTYIITGGTRGLGLEIGKWLASKGADSLVLISRTGASTDEAREAVAAMEKSGVNVMAAAIDIADYNEVWKLINETAQKMPPIRGIFHGAMVLDDGFIEDMTQARLTKVMLPKAAGAMNLHNATLTQPLDFFVSFSSIASLIGNTGQVNYVAANSFLEAFAYYRKSLRLPATTINLGVLAEVGVTSRNSEVMTLLEQAGIGGMSIEQVMYSLETIVDRKPVQTGLFKVDWKLWSQKNPGTARSARFSRLVTQDSGSDIPGHLRVHLEAMLELDNDARIGYIENLLVKELAAVLRLPADKINKKRPVMEQGVDSLMTVELRNRLCELFAAPLSAALFFNYPTVEKMAEYFIKNVISFEGILSSSEGEEEASGSDALKDLESLLSRISD
ncbi:acyl transferase domain-containing protein [Anaerobacterium chartisolvens]|uniref:Acyl transferase domain-containing protein n=1 Tax=Anaerobacterium chartisolvens TaxID=1297424 RepID=A0A369B6Q7_9FIRM|nr:type I polyketide synthase [Anaerobacterium chartisolvens]RCX16298.1 acyl transferase domain-containing protein [Anaerobacterium chartisolvens]